MTIPETCDTGVQQWKGMKMSPGYNYPLSTSATDSNSFTGAVLTGSSILGTIFNGDGSKNAYIYWMDPSSAKTVTGVGTIPQWYSTPKTNVDWLVGCDSYCQVISVTN